MCGIGIALTSSSVVNSCEMDKMRTCIRNRGPDSYEEYEFMDGSCKTISSVLHMRGEEIHKQPLVSNNGDVFLWNGEVFGGVHVNIICSIHNQVPQRSNDTEVVFQSLQSCSDVMSVLSIIQGPWAFIFYRVLVIVTRDVQKKDDCLYFGRDRLGRRSLVVYMSDNKQMIMIASTVDCNDIHPITLNENDWIHFSADAYHVIFENPQCPMVTSLHELPPAGIYYIPNISRIRDGVSVNIIPFPATLPRRTEFVPMENLFLEREEAAASLRQILEESVWKRISTIDCNPEEPRICIMFSGGIDCTILACLVCNLLKKHNLNWTLELVSIAFGDNVEEFEEMQYSELKEKIPDRYTACRSRFGN